MSSKREQWAKRLQRWERSGESRAAFCRAQRLNLSTFDYWRRRLRARGPGLVPVVVTGSGGSAAPIEIVLPNGLRLRMATSEVAHARAWVEALSC